MATKHKRLEVEPGFVKANSQNLPYVGLDAITSYLQTSELFVSAELKSKKLACYSQLILLTYGYITDRPADYAEMEKVAKKRQKKIRSVHGKTFIVGQSSRILYPVGGASDDWAKGVAGIKYSYTFELRDTGEYGFLLPADQIEPSGEEIVAGVKAMIAALWWSG